MSRRDSVALHGGGRAAFGAPTTLPVGAVFQTDTGLVVRVERDGRLGLLQQGGRPHAGVAGDPCVGGRPRRYP